MKIFHFDILPEALRDGIIPPFSFVTLEGEFKYIRNQYKYEGQTFTNATNEQQLRDALNTAISVNGDWVKEAILWAHNRMKRDRDKGLPECATYVRVSSISEARAMKERIKNLTREDAVVVVSKDDDNPGSNITNFKSKEDSSELIEKFASETGNRACSWIIGRYRLKHFFPDIDKTSEWGIDLITELLFNNSDAKVKLWRRYLLENKELNDAIRDNKTVNRAIYGCFLPDIDILHSVVSELMKLPFHLFENGVSFTGESPIVLEFIAAASKSKLLPKQKKLSNIRYLNNILDLVGLRAVSAGQSRGSDRKREYRLEDILCYHEVDEKGKISRTIMLKSLLEQCLDIRRDKLLEQYSPEYFDEKNQSLISGKDKHEQKVLLTREPIGEGEDIKSVVGSPIDATSENPDLPVVSKEITTSDATTEIDANKVKQIVSYFFNGVKSGMSIFDQITSSIERFGREIFEQACYVNSLLLGKCIDVDYKFMET